MMQKKAYTHIIWDWNGTLLDDLHWCVACINTMLAKRDMATLPSVAAYHDVFCFPIAEYYQNLGFDFDAEPFDILAKEYIDLYHGAGSDAGWKLHRDAEHVLGAIQAAGLSQIILSASSQENLLAQVSSFGIQPYFEEVLGISNIFARSKVDIGLAYLAQSNVTSGLLIGDSTHDHEVSQAMGVDCLLVAQGHQSRETLLGCNVPVCESLREVLGYMI